MSREKRIWYPGAEYHIMSRGVRRGAICRDQKDYEMFILQLKLTMEKMPFQIHSFCMMTNHLHMQITTRDIEVWKIMRYLLYIYSRYFNRRYGYSGHVFDSRYTACLIEDPVYFLEVSRYIHLNPVKAGMVKEPIQYPFSSYVNYVTEKENNLLDTDRILAYFKNDPKNEYRKFVEGMISHLEKRIQEDMGENREWLPW